MQAERYSMDDNRVLRICIEFQSQVERHVKITGQREQEFEVHLETSQNTEGR